jgi:hypothetical protein
VGGVLRVSSRHFDLGLESLGFLGFLFFLLESIL